MRIRWTKARRIAAIFSAVMALLGSMAFASGWGYRRNFHAWETAVPASGAIDLSFKNSADFAFKNTCSVAHGVELLLELPPEYDAKALLTGLHGRLEILTPAKGASPFPALEFTSDDIQTAEDTPAKTRLLWFHSLPQGDYIARITILEPATKLAGIPQSLKSAYLLCGLEAVPAYILFALGGGLWFSAVTTLALAFRFSRPRSEA